MPVKCKHCKKGKYSARDTKRMNGCTCRHQQRCDACRAMYQETERTINGIHCEDCQGLDGVKLCIKTIAPCR